MNPKIDTFVLKWGFERGQPLLKECEAELLELIKSLMLDNEFIVDLLNEVHKYTKQENNFHALEYAGIFKEYFREHILNQLDPSK